MIDICFNASFSDILLEASDLIHSDEIILLHLRLNYGQLNCNLIEKQAKGNVDTIKYMFRSVTEAELKEEYTEELAELHSGIKQVTDFLAAGQEIRLWLSNTANDRCALYWFCHLVKDFHNKISIVLCPGYEYSPSIHTASIQNDWALFRGLNFIAKCACTPRILDKYEKEAYARAWTLLVEEDAPLRILIDDTIVGIEESFFDSIILGFTKTEPQSQNIVMGKILGKWQGGCDAAFISMRIEHLIAEGKIKVCEEKVDENDCYWERTIALT